MQPAVTHRLFDRFALGVVILAVTLPTTYLEVTYGHWQQNGVIGALRAALARPIHQVQVAAATPLTRTTQIITTPVADAAAKTATTTSYVHLRSAKSTSSTILTSIEPGTTVQLSADSDATWQGATYQGKTGYIYRTYLQY